MKIDGVRCVTVVLAAFGALLSALSACGAAPEPGATHAGGVPAPQGRAVHSPGAPEDPSVDPTRIPGLGDRLYQRIPAGSSQVLVVYGEGRNSARSTVVLYTRHGVEWHQTRSWHAHNGRNGWTTDHWMDDERSPVGVFTLSDAGGVLPDPGTRLPYDHDEGAYAPPDGWDGTHQHDFDYVIAIDYNRVKGTHPHDTTRPEGVEKGGGIWLHLDHGGGTSGCISLPKQAMRYLLRTLDPARHPVAVMGNVAELRA
ncbi:L,D-transpeptidase family protein [Streptomyces sp. NPDC047085]|uniref:L,D-transpeptidase family protein n=1 Tax=Streptomyces sp. NPDC047085 TaxID=3155140 RepID=UPI0033DE5372